MKCISPIKLKNGYTVPCQKCNFCFSNKRSEWAFRLFQEWKVSSSSIFLTLTYDEKHVPYGTNYQVLHKPDLQKFFKRLRKKQSGSKKSNIKYYAVGEYGSNTYRPHYHALVFNLTDKVISDLQSVWPLGQIHVGNVEMKSIMYTLKYQITKSMNTFEVPPFQLCQNVPP